MRLVHGDVFVADSTLGALDLFDLVDQQKGIAVRQDALDQLDIGAQQLFGHGLSFVSEGC